MSSSTTQPASTDCFTTRWARSVPRRPFAALALVLLTFCHDDLSAPRSAGAAPSRDVLDGARGGGNPHFFFLQPIVATTPHSGTFDATELPIVEICALTNGACATPLVATYTMTSGFGSQTIRVSTSDQSYLVNWKTSDFTLDQNAVYRIRVKVLSTELGHADVRLVNNGSAAKNASTGDLISLVDGRTLPIKFRIENGAVAVVGTNGGSASLDDGAVALVFPAGAVAEPVAVTAAPVPVGSTGTDKSTIPGTLYEFQPSPTSFAASVTMTLRYGALPSGVHADRLMLCKMVGDACVFVPGGRVDTVTHSVSGTVNSFSTWGIGEYPQLMFADRARLLLSAAPDSIAVVADHTSEDVIGGGNSSFYFMTGVWSPDGARFAYSTLHGFGSDRVGHEIPNPICGIPVCSRIRAINWDGTQTTSLLGPTVGRSAFDLPWAPSKVFDWSPSGAELLVDSAWTNSATATFGATDLTGAIKRVIFSGAAPRKAKWSADGSHIAWTVGTDVYVANNDGSGIVRVAEVVQVDDFTWLANDTQLAVFGQTGWAGDGLFIVNSDGSNSRLLVEASVLHHLSFSATASISWAPYDSLLVVHPDLTYDGYEGGIYTVKSDGTHLRQIVGEGARRVSVLPDGRRIGFIALEADGWTAKIVNPDGTGLQTVGTASLDIWWRP